MTLAKKVGGNFRSWTKGIWLKTDNIPVMLVNAVTSIEDHRFFNTRGIDPIRIAGAFVNNLKGGSLNGGSTLDMQLIKLSFFSTDESDQTFEC